MRLARPQGSLATDDHNRPILLKFRSLSNPFLKLFKVAAVTALLSRAFHMLMMRSVKKYFLKSVLNLFLRNFLECPRVLPLVSYSKTYRSSFQNYRSPSCKPQSSQHLYLYLYLCLKPLTLGQKGLLADHWLSSNKILRVQCKAVLLPMLVQPFLESIHWRSWYHITWKIVPQIDDSELEKIGPQLSVT